MAARVVVVGDGQGWGGGGNGGGRGGAHAPGGGGSAGSRVLVSSLTLSQAELGEQLLATAHACGFPKKYGKVCTTGKNEMLCERKHYVAACAAQPPNRARGGTEANAVRLCAWISNVSASA